MLMACLLCVHPYDEKRPTMKQAGRMLKGGMMPEFPLKKPVSRYGIEEVETPRYTSRIHFSNAN